MRLSSIPKTILMAATILRLASAQGEPRPESERPERGVARISVINGDVSVQRGDSGDVVAAAINAPLVALDRVSTGPGSRAEIQFDSANMLRVGPNSEIQLSELQYGRYQIQVARGTVSFRVLRDSRSQAEVSTPVVSVRPAKRGLYRVSVRESGETEVTSRSGEVEIYTPRGVETVHAGQTMTVRGTAADPEFQIVRAAENDDWDRWNYDRDHSLERSASYRYVSPDIYGAEDLDAHGRWIYQSPYGYVWSPVVVAAGWAPYRYGRWVWEDWYGWTWVSYDPWGWAPYHYGRWFYSGPYGWCWYPGGFGRHYWSPALVAFFGFGGYSGVHVGFGFGGLGWVPLAPFERYHPWYGHGFYGGYRDVNVIHNNIDIINNTNITNIYRNARVGNAVSGVDAADFARGRFGNPRALGGDQIRQAGLVRGQLPLAPERESLRFAERQTGVAPRSNAFSGHFAGRREVAPVDRVPFDQQRSTMEQVSRRSSRAEQLSSLGGRRPSPANESPAHDSAHQSSVVGADSNRAANPGQTSGGGWHRFGNPSPRNESGGGSISTVQEPGARAFGAVGRTSSDGWRRIGESPNAAPQPSTPGNVDRTAASERGRGWNRFGEPGSNPAGSDLADGPQLTPRSQPDSSGNGAGRWQRFHPRSESQAQPDVPSSPGRHIGDYGGVSRGDRGRSLQIAPPIVRERSMPNSEIETMSRSPRHDGSPRSFGGDGGGFSRRGADAGVSRSNAGGAARAEGGANHSVDGGRSGGGRSSAAGRGR